MGIQDETNSPEGSNCTLYFKIYEFRVYKLEINDLDIILREKALLVWTC